MLRTRVMPCLLLEDQGLVKTVKFRDGVYIGDPINSVRIYNDMGVDELVFLDIYASALKQEPPFAKIAEIASECFMPFSYGGGIKTLEQAKKLFDIGVEKIVIGSAAIERPELISELSRLYGAQAVVVAIDVKRTMFNSSVVTIYNGKKSTKFKPTEYAKKMQNLGAGEILLNSVNQDGRMGGFDLETISAVSVHVDIPVIALGGCGNLEDIAKARDAGASAVGLGSMAVYQNRNKGILINFPTQKQLLKILGQ